MQTHLLTDGWNVQDVVITFIIIAVSRLQFLHHFTQMRWFVTRLDTQTHKYVNAGYQTCDNRIAKKSDTVLKTYLMVVQRRISQQLTRQASKPGYTCTDEQ
jgi:hypothetical protein